MFNIDRKRPCCGARPSAVEPVLFSINERSCRAGAEWRRGLPATPPTSARCDSASLCSLGWLKPASQGSEIDLSLGLDQSFQNPSKRSERSSVYRTVCMMLRCPMNLQCAGVDAIVGKLEAAGMAQHSQRAQ
jgi:hypothetical protein